MYFPYSKGYTHAGKFHADDVFATALIRIFNPDFKVERVFEVPEDVDTFDTIVYDIGRGEFDHHQDDSPVRENGVPYAAFGLIWRKFGYMIFPDEKNFKAFDSSFVQPIDECDNTGCFHQLSVIIGNFNPLWNEDTDPDDAFEEAVKFAKIILEREFKKREAITDAQGYVKDAYQKSDGIIVVMDNYVPWKNVIIDTNAKFVVFPSNRGGFNAMCVPVSESDNNPRIYFPEEWGALENEELEQASGIKNLKFCHKGRFMVAAKTQDAAIEAAKAALQNNNINNK